jgi:hypothetical protein
LFNNEDFEAIIFLSFSSRKSFCVRRIGLNNVYELPFKDSILFVISLQVKKNHLMNLILCLLLNLLKTGYYYGG